MVNKNDWRLTNQINYLYEKELTLMTYQPGKDWDHDHCEFCWEKFIDKGQIGYVTKDMYHWVCPKCYNDFKEMFKWK